MALLQWNIRGIRAHREELQLLLRSHCPLIAGLQETKLRPHDHISFSHYTSVRFDLPPAEGTPAHGGVMFLVRDDVSIIPSC